jgi:hypothetical protein
MVCVTADEMPAMVDFTQSAEARPFADLLLHCFK